MACIVLPSETARLVYGYLVKENLNDIALKFLETSPYLTDCLHITKQGYNFNTKLFSKDLHELLQEYSTIHNLVNNKINILPKNTLLYKRIKLKCESLSEIIESLLFWKYRYQKKEDDSLVKDTRESQKDENCQISTEQTRISNDNSNKINISSNNNVNENCVIDNNEHVSTHNNVTQDENTNCTSNEEKPSDKNEILTSCETTVNSNLPPEPENFDKTDGNNVESSDIQNTETCNEISNVHDGNTLMHGGGQSLLEKAMEMDSTPLYEEENPIQSGGNIEILRMETSCDIEAQTLDLYQDSLKGNEVINNGNITEDSPVVFLDPAVGNFKISTDPNQIIVIPIDYYKGSPSYNHTTSNQNTGGGEVAETTTNIDCNQQSDYSYQVIAEEPALAPYPTEPNPSNSTITKNPVIDSNIITAENFTPVPPPPPPVVQERIVLVPQVRDRFRKILPRQKKVKEVETPAVVYVNVPILNPDPAKPTGEPQPQPQLQPQPQPQLKPQPDPKLKENNNNNKNKRRSTKNNVNTRRIAASKKNRSPGNRNMPNITTVVLDESPLKVGDDGITVVDPNDKTETDKASEEKENKEEKTESKIETPVVLTTRNLKRLSLSTPRRRSSHIRALEFETPPKTNDEKKKSQTSPKVKVDQVTVERKSVRNTLFKSPDLETVFKSPACLKSHEKNNEGNNETAEPLNELSIPIATRSPKVDTLSETWENLTGMGCMLAKPDNEEDGNKKRPWDADLRSALPADSHEIEFSEKKRARKPEKSQKDNKKPVKKKLTSGKKGKSSPPSAPPSASKINITAKRNTYSISENEEKSPVRNFQEDANLMTPFKYPEIDETPFKFRSVEETPLSKLLMENGLGNGMDIDLSMIPTPTIPLTPSILEELSGLGAAKYFTPSKDESKSKSTKITDYFKIDPNKQETKETHEKIVSDIITKAREITGLEEKKRPCGGKMLSMHKIITIATSDKKLIENIPINEEPSFQEDSIADKTSVGNLTQSSTNFQLEIEEKKKRTALKCKDIKENLSTKSRLLKRNPRKRKRSGGDVQKSEKKSKLDLSSDTTGEKLTESDESGNKDAVLVHSTPYADRKRDRRLESSEPVKQVIAYSILSVIPKFEDHMNVQDYPELPFVWRKKFYYVENFLKLTEIREFLKNFDDGHPSDLTSDYAGASRIFYTWAKELNGTEMQGSDKTKKTARAHLVQYNKIKKGLLNKSKKIKRDLSKDESSTGKNHLDAAFRSYGEDKSQLSDEEESDFRKTDNDTKKEEEVEDGIPSTLPLKKRKANVPPLKMENSMQETPEDLSTTSNENVHQTLRSLDLEPFLHQIHNQTDR